MVIQGRRWCAEALIPARPGPTTWSARPSASGARRPRSRQWKRDEFVAEL